MAKFTFVPYSIRVRKKRDDKYLKLDTPNPKNTDQIVSLEFVNFLKIFESFLQSLPQESEAHLNIQSPTIIEESKISVDADQEDNDIDDNDEKDSEGELEENIVLVRSFALEAESSSIKGLFLAGDVEEGSDVYDPVTNQVRYKIEQGLVLSRPFYFRVRVSRFSERGILILQTFKKYGIKDILQKELNSYLRREHEDILIEINPYVPKGLIEHYLEERVLEVQLIKFGFPAELIDKPMDNIPLEESETITKGNLVEELDEKAPEGKSIMLFKPGRGSNLPKSWLDKIRSNAKKLEFGSDDEIRNLVEVKNFEYDNVKIKVKIGKNIRTINLSKKDSLRYNEELDSSLVIDSSTGHPQFDSIDSLGKDFISSCAEEVWGGQLNEKIAEET